MANTPYGNYNFGYDPSNPSTDITGVTDYTQPQAPSTSQALMGGVGAGLSALGQYQQQQQQQQQSALMQAAQLAQNQYQQQQQLNLSKASQVAANNPLGAQQGFAQRQALLSAILPNLRNFQSTPGDSGVAAAMGGNRGGIMNALPQGGLDPSMISAMFGPNATQASLQQNQAQLSNMDPNAPVFNTQAMYGSGAAPTYLQMLQYAQGQKANANNTQNAFQNQQNGDVNKAIQSSQSHWYDALAPLAGAIIGGLSHGG